MKGGRKENGFIQGFASTVITLKKKNAHSSLQNVNSLFEKAKLLPLFVL